MNLKLLEQLVSISSATGEEAHMTNFILDYVRTNRSGWAGQPKVLSGAGFQDCVMLVFGQPRTAVYAHMDTIGFTARYQNQLIPIGSPAVNKGDKLQGKDDLGDIVCKVDIQDSGHLLHDFARPIERGTALTYATQWQEDSNSISTPYLDNRVGLFTLLTLASEMQHGVLVFSCGEEHGGGYAGFLARYLFDNYDINQSLIADVTWVTDGVVAGEGVAISLRDSLIPRKAYVNKIVDVAKLSPIQYQLEVEGSGGSDGSEIHIQPYPIDWCFVGAPILHPHAALETINKGDLLSMVDMYQLLMTKL